jgi:HEAT repeat protein
LRVLAEAAAAAAGLLLVLILLLIGVRAAALRRARREQEFRPAAEAALGQYLAGTGDAPTLDQRGERDVFLAIAQEALADLRGAERDRLAALLLRLGYTEDAMRRLRARHTAVRRRAAETLALLATPLAAPAVTAGLADRDLLVRTTCAVTLAETGSADVLPSALAAAARDAAAAPGRAACVVLAVARRRPDALAPLLRAGAHPAIRRIAVTVAADLRLAELSGLLLACLDSPDELAAPAAYGLGRIGEFGASGALARLAADRGRSVAARSAATEALGALGDPDRRELLAELLAAPEWPVRSAAAQSLAGLGEPGAAVLRRAVAAGDPLMAPLAQAALHP